MNPLNGLLEKSLPLLAALLVLPPWVWLAVRTKHCLEVITAHTIPFPKRMIWLAKVLALVVGVGGILGVASELGIPWYLAILPGAGVVFLACNERVQAVVPPRPSQDPATYQSSWQTYRQLRSDVMRSWIWLGASFLLLILTAGIADRIPKTIQMGLFGFCAVAVLFSIGVMSYKQLKWIRWPCPRCGCAFRGFWGRPWLPRNCVYCGLPRAESPSLRSPDSR